MSSSGNEHKLRDPLEDSGDRVFLIAFTNGDVFRLRRFVIVDHSIYGDPDKWCADVVEPVSGARPQFKQLFRPGTGLDFLESDIASIRDEVSDKLVYARS